MPDGREKKTHPVGVSLKVKLVITDKSYGYTGLFEHGCDHGIMRISEFADTNPDIKQIVPGFGVKWLKSGCPSANGFVMNHFDGFTGSFNFFKKDYFSHLGLMDNVCVKETLGRKMLESGTVHISAMSVMNWAVQDQDCNDVAEPHFPYSIRVTPLDVFGWPDHYEDEFYNQLA